MRLTRAFIPCIAAMAAAACSTRTEPTPEPNPDSWVAIGYFSSLDPLTVIHVVRTLQLLGVEWRQGKEGWRGYNVEIRDRDRSKVTAALVEDQTEGNIHFLDGVPSPEFAMESVRMPTEQFLGLPRVAGDELLKRALEHADLKKALKQFPNVEAFAVRTRSCLGEDNRRHKRMEGRIEVVVDLHEEIAGKRLQFTVSGDDLVVEVRSAGAWWKGVPETIELNKKKYGLDD